MSSNWMFVLSAVALVASGCGRDEPPKAPDYEEQQQRAQGMQPAAGTPQERTDPSGMNDTIPVTLQTSNQTQLRGQARLAQRQDGVLVDLTVSNAEPGTYAVHIHQRDDCSDIPGESMGGHFNPTGEEHGLPRQAEHHLGDLGNMEVGQDGTGNLTIEVPNATLKKGDEKSFLGRALVIHSGADDGQGKSGHAGKPMACGPIRDSN